jgi:hypothetical protein
MAKPFFATFFWLAATTFLFGCLDDRQTGTEVGNPEVTVLARLDVIEDGDTLHMDGFNLKVMQANYITRGGDTGSIWKIDSGTMVDLSQPASAKALPAMTMDAEPWIECELVLDLPKGRDSLPDSMQYGGLNGYSWARWREDRETRPWRFLFYLPEGFRLRLYYGEKTMQPWHVGDTVYVTVTFDAGAFAHSLPSGNWQTRMGSDGQEFCVLSPRENAEAHAKMLAAFPSCFKADSRRPEIMP